jgi:hypothetical protein
MSNPGPNRTIDIKGGEILTAGKDSPSAQREFNLALVSIRPQPGTPAGDIWESGFRYAWDLRDRMEKG